eukprot:TRINITY_DN61674_c0_g1_i1.p1 TRINITY_DN61674_c0_g1~~TRINITY_DN61674_c0_g1_i1.p1  ORF type:complete len:152 (+),score=38.05 TRINITY_DN61674_c0_g1_i1:249-704(+)
MNNNNANNLTTSSIVHHNNSSSTPEQSTNKRLSLDGDTLLTSLRGKGGTSKRDAQLGPRFATYSRFGVTRGATSPRHSPKKKKSVEGVFKPQLPAFGDDTKRSSTTAAARGGGLSLIHISEPTRLLSISYAVFCLKKKNNNNPNVTSYVIE